MAITPFNSVNGFSVGNANTVIDGNANVTAANVSGSYFIGNGRLLTGVVSTTTSTSNGTSNIGVPIVNGNIKVTVANTSVGSFTSSGLSISAVTATGNVTANNITSTNDVTANSFSANLTSGYVVGEGEIAWNATDLTFDMGMSNGVTLQVGQENYILVKASGAIADGQVVMFAGARGDNILGTVANAQSAGFRVEYVIGVATQAIADNAFGYVTVFGKVHGLNTNAYNVGDLLWLDPTTPGAFTTTEPVAPNPKALIATVIKKSGGDGHIMVRPTLQPTLGQLSDVNDSSVTTGDYLRYNGTAWIDAALDISDDTTPVLGGNLNANTYSITGVGNIIPSANVTYDLGNATNQWKSLWVSNNTIYINSIPLTVNSNSELLVNTNPVVTTSTSGNSITQGNMTIQGTVSANYISGNGSQLTSLPGANVVGAVAQATSATSATTAATVTTNAQPNITSVGALTSLTVSGDGVFAGNLSVQGDIIYNNVTEFNVEDPVIGLGRGANNTPLTSDDGMDRGEQLWYYDGAEGSAFVGYQNTSGKLLAAANVSIANNVVTVNSYGNILLGGIEATSLSASGNITGAYIIGNGSQLTGLPPGYANSDVSTYLASGTNAANIITTANVSGAYILGNGSALTSLSGAAVTGTVANASYATNAGTAALANIATVAYSVAAANVSGEVANAYYAEYSNVAAEAWLVDGANVFGAVSSATLAATANIANIAYSVDAANVVGTVAQAAQANTANLATVATTAYAVDGANVSGTVANASYATLAGTVTTAAQPNITSVGTLSSLTSTGLISTTGNVSGLNLLQNGVRVYKWTTSNVAPANPVAGDNWYDSTSDSLYQYVFDGVSSQWVDTSSPSTFNTIGFGNATNSGANATGNIGSASGYYGNAYVATVTAAQFIGNGSQLTGINSANISGTVAQAAQANIANIANVAYSVAAANVSGTVANAAYATNAGAATTATTAATVTTNAQPNITSVGALTSLTVSGDTTIVGNLSVDGDIVYNNVTSFNVEDPIIGLGRGANNAPLTTDDGKDRGEQLWYYNGAEKSAFIGYDNSTGKMTAAVDVAVANDVVTVNSLGNIVLGGVEATSVSASGNITAAYILGNGSQLTSLTGSAVTGAVANATYATTAGTAYAVSGANVSGFVANATLASTANVAYSVDAANVSGLGNVATLNLNGNATTYLAGNGSWQTVSAGSTYGDANVSTYLAGGTNTAGVTSTGNIVGGNLTTAGTANVTTLAVSGNATINGTGSNVIRRASGLVAADTYVTLDDISANVSSSTSQLGLYTSGSWQGTGWTETYTSGSAAVSNWVNLPLSTGYSSASGAMNNQGNGCKCIISDQTPTAKVYEIVVVRSGTSGAMWNISITRLV